MNTFKFIIVTIVFFFLSHYLAVFPHEFCHSITAWLLGLKVHPLNIDYGGKSLLNILLLFDIDENNNYVLMYLLGKKHLIPIIAFAGPGMNVLLYLVSSYLLFAVKSLRTKPLLLYFIVWYNLMNLGNIVDYMPNRVFTTHGDIGHILFGLNNLSPWWLFIPGTYVVVSLLYIFYKKTLPMTYVYVCGRNNIFNMIFLVVASTIVLLGFFPAAGIAGYSAVSTFVSGAIMSAIPAIIFINWPMRRWVAAAMNNV